MTSRFVKKALVTSLATLIATSAQAGVLADIYQQALKNDATYQASRAEAAAGDAGLAIALSNLYPDITLNGSSTSTHVGESTTESKGATLSIDQTLFSMPAWYGYKAADTLPAITSLKLAAADQSLITRTVNSYIGALKAKSALEVAEAQERAVKRRLDQVNAQFDVGLTAITDVLEAQATYDSARVGLINAQSAVRNSLEALEKLTGNTAPEIKDLKANYPITTLDSKSASEWIDKALSGNVALQLKKQAEISAGYEASAYASAHLPTLSLNHSMLSGEKTYEARGDQTTTIRLSMPIFSGFETTAKADKYANLHEQALFNYEGEVRTVRSDTAALVRDLESSAKAVDAQAVSVQSREKALEATSQGFEVGTRNVVDVLNAESALYAAKKDYASARLDHIALVMKMKLTVGTLSPSEIEELDDWLES
ncbi:TolC family outer membrane protein [Marinobacterium sp. LSUCC0821]|uniref:TolC family outer membrane protein n=1 Tax=Marinobacterium sp. LSUCC0821 TaxID=2668067 RepID=UPI0014515A37|nr:TolC family outer membrane protein [Marinobacterium sp. LSUCC0821]QJD70689.1 TolC family outer membrane protein [Marinobacterium sp. LSUCC0821]